MKKLDIIIFVSMLLFISSIGFAADNYYIPQGYGTDNYYIPQGSGSYNYYTPSGYGSRNYYDYSYYDYYNDYSYSDYSYYDNSYYDSCYYYNSCYSTYDPCYYNNCNNYPPTPNPGYPPQQSYTPPNNLVYGGPTPYVNPIPPLNIRTFSCRDPDGYEGDLKTFGIGTQAEFRCTQGIWVFIRQIPFVITSPPQTPTQNKLDFYGGIRETPVQQNQPSQNQPPLVYTRPPSYQQPVAVHCTNPVGLNGEIRYFGLVNPQPFICINGQWYLDP